MFLNFHIVAFFTSGVNVDISVYRHRFVQSKSNSTRQLLEFILQLQIFEQVMAEYFNYVLVFVLTSVVTE